MRNRSGTQPEADIPWSASAPYDPEELAAREQNDCPADRSLDGSELLPYCVMPYVERLLKVCLPTAPTRLAIKAAYSTAGTSISCMQKDPSHAQSRSMAAAGKHASPSCPSRQSLSIECHATPTPAVMPHCLRLFLTGCLLFNMPNVMPHCTRIVWVPERHSSLHGNSIPRPASIGK